MVDVQNLRRLLSVASPRPWWVENRGVVDAHQRTIVADLASGRPDWEYQADQELVAAAVNALPAPLDCWERAHAPKPWRSWTHV